MPTILPNCDEKTRINVVKAFKEIFSSLYNISLRTHAAKPTVDQITIIAYLAYMANDDLTITLDELLANPAIPNEVVKCVIRENITAEAWKEIEQSLIHYTPDVYAYVALNADELDGGPAGKSVEEFTTPGSIIDLANAIAGIRPNWNIADIGCGKGTYLLSTAEAFPYANYYGYEINTTAGAVATIRATLKGLNARIVPGDAFALLSEDSMLPHPEQKFDFIFSNYPFGIRARSYINTKGAMHLLDRYPGIQKATTADWLFNALIHDMLSDTGKAICISSSGCTWNTSDHEIRKQFVEQGYIEAIIALPERIFASTPISTSMIILSHGNTSIKMVDATGKCVEGRRVNIIDANQCKEIVSAIANDTDISKRISIDEIRKNKYALNPGRYLQSEQSYADGIPFGDIIRSIRRGAAISANELDEISSNEPTGMQYLALSDIQDGIISPDLKDIKRIDKANEKYCIEDGNIILSKFGRPYKIATAGIEAGKRILASGNLYIIAIDETRADPYYIQAFLESNQGAAQLDAISVGTSLRSIGVEQLKDMIIPLPPMAKQKQIADAFRTIQGKITDLKKALEKAQEERKHIWDKEASN